MVYELARDGVVKVVGLNRKTMQQSLDFFAEEYPKHDWVLWSCTTRRDKAGAGHRKVLAQAPLQPLRS